VHTWNATALAIPRILINILEYYQDEKGWIKIPNCLKNYIRENRIFKY